MKKRILIALGLVLAFCLAFTTAVFATQATKQSKITYRSISIVVNGTEIAPVDVNGVSTEPFILNSDGSTYLPVRAVGDALGLDVGWDGNTSTVILNSGGTPKYSSKTPAKTNNEKTVTLTYRNIKITLDGKQVALLNAKGEAVEPFIYNNSTYLPVRAVATALGCEIGWDGKTSTVTITKNSVSDLKITKQPVDYEYDPNYDEAVFSVTAAGGVEPYAYEWQKDSGGNGVFSAYSGGNKSTVRINLLMSNGNLNQDVFLSKYRCKVTDASGNIVYTDKVSISEPVLPLTITTQPKGTSIAVNQTGTVSITVSGGVAPYKFEWQDDCGSYWGKPERWVTTENNDAGVLITSTANSSKMEITPSSDGYFLYSYPIRCVVTDAKGNKVISNKIQITNPLRITTQPVSQSIAVNNTATLSVAVTGGSGSYTYNWYADYNGGTLDLATTASYDYSNAEARTSSIKIKPTSATSFAYSSKFYCVVKDSKGNTVTTTKVTLTAPGPLSIKTQPPAIVNVPYNSTVNIQVEPSGGSGNYTYQWQVNQGSGWVNLGTNHTIVKNYNTRILSVSGYQAINFIYGAQFRCVISDGTSTVTSNVVTIPKNE